VTKMSKVLPFRAPPADTATRAIAPDDAGQRESALDVQQSFLVEAPAGSGKTALLLQRYLKLLALPSVTQPEEVLAVTFTRKSTSELRERALTQLTAAAERRANPLDPATLSPFDAALHELAEAALKHSDLCGWELLQQPQRLNIRTLDSLAAEISRSLPVLSGAGQQRQPTTDAKELYALAAKRTLMLLGGSDAVLNSSLQLVLLHLDGNLANCERLLAGMLEWREQWAELVPLAESDRTDLMLESVVRPRLERALTAIVCAGLGRIERAAPAGWLHDASLVAAHFSRQAQEAPADWPLHACAAMRGAPQAVAEQFEQWTGLLHLCFARTSDSPRGDRSFASNHFGVKVSPADKQRVLALNEELSFNAPLRAAFLALRDLPPAHFPDDQWKVASALFHLLVRALAELKVLFAERAQCDFTEISLDARQALNDPGGAEDFASSVGLTLRHLLVDEMQDTSAAQYEIIERLTAGWDGRSQTLFLVGDPKQSIYAFRQARVERFLRMQRELQLGGIALVPLLLTRNFRSRAALVRAFNYQFSLIFPDGTQDPSLDGDALDVPYTPATAADATDTEDLRAHWHVCEIDKADPAQNAEAARRQEAEELTAIVQSWRARPLPLDRRRRADGSAAPWKIAVLAANRRHLQQVLVHLREAEIAYRAIGIEPLGERPEVLDLLALTRALQHPADRVAWLAVLHAPWCGLDRVDLLALAGEGVRESAKQSLPTYVEGRAALLSIEGQRLLARAWPSLQASLDQTGRMPLAELVERTWMSLGGDVSLTANYRANAQSYLALLREVEGNGARVDLDRLLRRMGELYAAPEAHEDAVELLTIHNAKGLEWDVVLVPGLDRAGAKNTSRLLNWLERDAPETEARVVLAPIQASGDEAGSLNRWLNKARAQREDAERKRLFYVACTRAREELHLFAACARNKEGAWSPTAHTQLEAAWPVAEAYFVELEQKAAAAAVADDARMDVETADVYGGESGPLELAASGDAMMEPRVAKPLLLHRLPQSFDPRKRFAVPASMPYVAASSLRAGPRFARPEGSFEARALGNVVHRFLEVLAQKLQDGAPDLVYAGAAQWVPRITAALRSEGLSPAAVRRAAGIAHRSLMHTLEDAEGLWLLSSHTGSATEMALQIDAGHAGLRIDRTFVAGDSALSAASTHLWIVDFKTSAQSSNIPSDFDQEQRRLYGAQLAGYADALRSTTTLPMMLALYYPLVPRLVAWPAE
jgi:ATP-dependent helicase/nuclease subunit A